ncbi:MAG: FlgO family outer membrane protein [Deltaproteobacteria bacterium]|jgi:TolB-like protein|nr:FlgO family outer membrane protein [Deltaproteobacteria bacterium]
MQNHCFLIFIIVSLFCIGCSNAQNKAWNPDDNLLIASYRIVEGLEKNLTKSPLTPNDLIIVASFVDVSDLGKSTPFGRIIAEQIGSRLSQKGFQVIELKLRQKSIFIDSEGKGEFLLSRNLKDISLDHNVSAVVVGTYTPAYDKIYVSTRIIDPKSNIIRSAYDYKIPVNYKDLRALLKN